MGKEKGKQIMALVLSLICVVMVVQTFVFRKRPLPPASPALSQNYLPPAASSAAFSTANAADPVSILNTIRRNQGLKEAQAAVWQKDWGRDPFFPAVSAANGGGVVTLILSGIVWDPQAPIAILNGEMAKTGMVIADHRIVEIRQSSVVVSDASGTKTELELFEKKG